MKQGPRKLNMYEPAVFAICIQREIAKDRADYFSAQMVVGEMDEAGQAVTVLTTEPVDQASLVGMINHINMLGVPLLSIECLDIK